MMSFLHTKKGQYVGLGVLVVILVANVWLFWPRFVNGNQELTTARLAEQQLALADSAQKASDLAAKVSQSSMTRQQANESMQPLLDVVDHALLQLRTGKHQTDLSEEVTETLRLAEVLSFTMRNYATDASTDSLASAQTAHILKMSARQAEQLSED